MSACNIVPPLPPLPPIPFKLLLALPALTLPSFDLPDISFSLNLPLPVLPPLPPIPFKLLLALPALTLPSFEIVCPLD